MTPQQQNEIEAKILINFMILNSKITALKSVLSPEQLLGYQTVIDFAKQKFQADIKEGFLTQEQVDVILKGLDKQ